MASNKDFAEGEGLEPQVKKFYKCIKIGRRGKQISATQTNFRQGLGPKLVTKRYGDVGGSPSRWAIFKIFGKNSYFNSIWITFRTFLEPFENTKFLRLKSQLKKFFPLLQVKSKTRLKCGILGLNFVIWCRSGEARYLALGNIFSIKYVIYSKICPEVFVSS